ncbi:MAG: S9 family peptidase [Pseudomonadota bacterium]
MLHSHRTEPIRCTAPLLCILAFLGWAAPSAAITGFSLLTPERLWDLAEINDPQVSPDGRYVVFTVTSFPRGGDTPAIDLWLVEADGKGEPRQLTRNPGPDVDPVWSPDGRSIAYASSRPGTPSTDIFLLNLRGGEPVPLTRFPTDARKPRFRGDGSSIVFEASTFPDLNDDHEALGVRLAAVERLARTGMGTESRVTRRNGQLADARLVQHLFEVSLDGASVRDLTPDFADSVPIAEFEWDLSANGELLAYTGIAAEPPYLTIDRDLYLTVIDEGRRLNLTGAREGSAFRPRFDREGGLLFGEHTRTNALAEHTRLVRLELNRQSFTILNEVDRLSPEEWVVAPESRQLYFVAEENGGRHVFRTSLQGGKARRVINGGHVSALRIGRDENLYYLRSTLTRPPFVERTDANGNHGRMLADLNQTILEDTRIGAVDRVEFAGHARTTVDAHLILPPGFSSERRWPVLVLLHGGPHLAWLDQFYRRWSLMAFAAPGYVVLALNPHGSTGYGQAFADSIQGDPLGAAATDVLAGVEHLETYPWVDPDRIAVVGGSYGGYLANWLLTRTDRFAAAVVHAGIFDLMIQAGSDYPWGRERTYGASPWIDPDRYRALSPSTFAARIGTPTLLLHGERDHRVPVAHSLIQHNMMTARGVPSRLVLFPNDGHQIDRRTAAQRWWSEVFAWLERHAPPGPAAAARPAS